MKKKKKDFGKIMEENKSGIGKEANNFTSKIQAGQTKLSSVETGCAW